MYCDNCGREIDDRAVICPHCGVEVGKRSFQPEKSGNTLAVVGVRAFVFYCDCGIDLFDTWIQKSQKRRFAQRRTCVGGYNYQRYFDWLDNFNLHNRYSRRWGDAIKKSGLKVRFFLYQNHIIFYVGVR